VPRMQPHRTAEPLSTPNPVRHTTFRKVAAALAKEPAVTSGKAAMALKGVGKGSAALIDEFLETATFAVLEEAAAEKEPEAPDVEVTKKKNSSALLYL